MRNASKSISILLLYIGTEGGGAVGGMGGNAAKDGDDLDIGYFDNLILGHVVLGIPMITGRTDGKSIQQGDAGTPNSNKLNKEYPNQAKFINSSYVINSYKNYWREIFSNNIQKNKLISFLNMIENDKRIESLYDMLGYVNELSVIETQYLSLRNKISFIPFYESLLNRIENYIKSTNQTQDSMKVLTFLYSVVLGKLSDLKNYSNHIVIVDLYEFLQLVQNNVAKLKETQKEISTVDQLKTYKDSLYNKIKGAISLINTEIIPAIQHEFIGLENEISDLVEIIIEEKRKAQREALKLQRQFRTQKLLGGLELASTVLEAFGGIGKVISIGIDKVVDFVDKQEFIQQIIGEVLISIENAVGKLKDKLLEPFHLYSTQLDDMNNIIEQQENPKSFEKLLETIHESQAIVNKTIESPGFADTRLINVLRKNLNDQIDLIELDYDEDEISNSKSPNFTVSKSKVKDFLKYANVIKDVSVKLWNKHKARSANIELIADRIEKVEAQIDKYDELLAKIVNDIQPALVQIQLTIEKLANDLENQTPSEIDISSWQTTTALGDFKRDLREYSKALEIELKLERICEKIEEGFGVMVTIFQRIQTYKEQAEFTTALTQIFSPNSLDIQSEELRATVLNMKRLIETNKILEQYESAMHSFKQHEFPFAYLYLRGIDLPADLKPIDSKTVAKRATEEVSYLQNQVKLLEISVGKFDSEIFGDINFNNIQSGTSTPFYTFKNREFKNEFRKLLKGEEILLVADIEKGLTANAIKFKEIAINLKLTNKELQNELNVELENFAVRMTLVSNGYYRCDQQVYTLSVDDNIILEYSFKRNAHGKPDKINDVFRKLSENSAFLSPYAAWKIRLIEIKNDLDVKDSLNVQNAFDKLKRFINEPLNLEIIGRGKFFRSNGTFSPEVCTDEMSTFYEFDKARSATHAVDILKSKYSLTRNN